MWSLMDANYIGARDKEHHLLLLPFSHYIWICVCVCVHVTKSKRELRTWEVEEHNILCAATFFIIQNVDGSCFMYANLMKLKLLDSSLFFFFWFWVFSTSCVKKIKKAVHDRVSMLDKSSCKNMLTYILLPSKNPQQNIRRIVYISKKKIWDTVIIYPIVVLYIWIEGYTR